MKNSQGPICDTLSKLSGVGAPNFRDLLFKIASRAD